MEELFFELKQKVYEKLDINLDVSDEDLYKVIDVCIYEISQHRAISVHNRELLRQQLYNSIKRLDILQELLEDDDITEIMINGYKDIFIEKKGRITKWNKQFESREKLEDIAQRIAAMSNKTINEAIPIVDTRLADGSRVNMVFAHTDKPFLFLIINNSCFFLIFTQNNNAVIICLNILMINAICVLFFINH